MSPPFEEPGFLSLGVTLCPACPGRVFSEEDADTLRLAKHLTFPERHSILSRDTPLDSLGPSSPPLQTSSDLGTTSSSAFYPVCPGPPVPPCTWGEDAFFLRFGEDERRPRFRKLSLGGPGMAAVEPSGDPQAAPCPVLTLVGSLQRARREGAVPPQVFPPVTPPSCPHSGTTEDRDQPPSLPRQGRCPA